MFFFFVVEWFVKFEQRVFVDPAAFVCRHGHDVPHGAVRFPVNVEAKLSGLIAENVFFDPL